MSKLLCKISGITLNNNFSDSYCGKGTQYSIHPLFFADMKTVLRTAQSAVNTLDSGNRVGLLALAILGRMDLIAIDRIQSAMNVQKCTLISLQALIQCGRVFQTLPERDLKVFAVSMPKYSGLVTVDKIVQKLVDVLISFDPSITDNPAVADIKNLIDAGKEIDSKNLEIETIYATLKKDQREYEATRARRIRQGGVAKKYNEKLNYDYDTLIPSLDLSASQVQLFQIITTQPIKSFIGKIAADSIVTLQGQIHDQIPDMENHNMFALTNMDFRFREVLDAYNIQMEAFGIEIKKSGLNKKAVSESLKHAVNLEFIIDSPVKSENSESAPVKPKLSIEELRALFKRL